MKSKAILGLSLTVLAVAVIWFWLRQPNTLKQFSVNTPPAQADIALRGAPSHAEHQAGTNIVIQTGTERMSNAVRCMSFIIDLANKLPDERASDKPMLRALAGVTFFYDGLMSKMSNGFIAGSSNELRQSFSNALAQLYSTNVPQDVSAGFNYALTQRNNLRISMNEQYRRMALDPPEARSLNQLTKVIGEAGVTDADQSDLKEMALGFCETYTSALSVYGAQGAEFQAMADALNQIFEWRLTNMYGLDSAAARRLSQAALRVPVDAFGQAGLQPPAFIQ